MYFVTCSKNFMRLKNIGWNKNYFLNNNVTSSYIHSSIIPLSEKILINLTSLWFVSVYHLELGAIQRDILLSSSMLYNPEGSLMCTDHLKTWNILTEFLPNSLTRKRLHYLDFGKAKWSKNVYTINGIFLLQ